MKALTATLRYLMKMTFKCSKYFLIPGLSEWEISEAEISFVILQTIVEKELISISKLCKGYSEGEWKGKPVRFASDLKKNA
jgi:hypothetical protein